VEVTMVVETGQRVGLREMLESRSCLRVVERKRCRVAEPLRELELVLDERRLFADPVDVERAFERPARDQGHDDDRLGIVRRARDDMRAGIEVSLIRPHGRSMLGRPTGQPDAVRRPVAHDLLFVFGRTRQDRHQLPACLVRLVDVQRLVRHQIAERGRDALEQRIECLLREHFVEHLCQPAVRLDERLGAAGTVRFHRPCQGRPGRRSLPDHLPLHRRAGRSA